MSGYKCSSCGEKIIDSHKTKFCHGCGIPINEKTLHIDISKPSFFKTNGFVVLFVMIVLVVVSFFTVPIPYDMTVGYTVKEPYNTQEYYTTQEPYETSYQECAKHSFWTGRCTEYITLYRTEYRTVGKYRTVTNYRDVEKERIETAHATGYEFLFKTVQWYRRE